MKLLTAPASPFARKAEIMVIELGLQESVSIENPGAVTPVSNNAQLNAVNPLGMLPALELDDGDCLYDSPVICEYLNQLADGPFFPGRPRAADARASMAGACRRHDGPVGCPAL